MAIEYAGGTIVRTTLDGTVYTNFIADLKAALESAGWTSVTNGANDYTLTCVKTPYGLQMKVRLALTETSYAGVTALGMDDVAIGGQAMYIGAGQTFECLATRYCAYIWTNGITAALPPGGVFGWASDCAFGVPFLPDPVVPLTVNGASNTSPIEITTIEDHGFISGQSVFIEGVGGNTGANGSHAITVTGVKTFTLDGSSGTGAYTSGGFVGNTSRVSKCLYINGSDGTGALPTNGFRSDPFQTLSTSGITSYVAVAVNDYSVNSPAMNTPIVQPAEYPWRNGRSVITEPYMKVLSQTQGQLYNAVVIRGTPTPPRDTLFTMDGHSWTILGTGGTNSALAIAIN